LKDSAIQHLQKGDFLSASIDFNRDCRNKKIEGLLISTEQKDIYLSNVISNISYCNQNYRDKVTSEVKSCLSSFDLKDAIAFTDNLASTSFKNDYNNWDQLTNGAKYREEAAAKVKAGELVRKKFEDEKVEAAKKDRDFKSGQDLMNQACSYDFIIRRNQKFIDNEHEVGKVSGFVDKNKLHRFGSEIVAIKKYLSSTEKQYQQRLGKPFKLSGCKDPFDLNSI